MVDIAARDGPKVTLDATATSWTIVSEEDGVMPHKVAYDQPS
jgi:hypothetical protein